MTNKTMSFPELIKEAEKGCGNWNDNDLVKFSRECGDDGEFCKKCKVKIQTLKTDAQMVKDKINYFIQRRYEELNSCQKKDCIKCDVIKGQIALLEFTLKQSLFGDAE